MNYLLNFDNKFRPVNVRHVITEHKNKFEKSSDSFIQLFRKFVNSVNDNIQTR